MGKATGSLYGKQGLVLIAVTAAAFHVFAYFTVKSFYSQNLPHYDSIGTYTRMFQIITSYHSDGFKAALDLASSYHHSWLQSFFALVGAPFLNTSPQSVQLYNTLVIFFFMVSIYLAAKAAGAGEVKSYLLSLMVFLPDVFYDWWGGLLDLQRDPSFVSLLGATFFLFFALVWTPSIQKSILLGLAAGLTVLSRGNALFMLIAIMGPIIGIWVLRGMYLREWKLIIKNLLPASVLFCLVAAPNLYSTLLSTIIRYQNPYVSYAIGDNAWVSLSAHWSKPFQIVLGQIENPGSHAYYSFWLSGGFLLIVIFLGATIFRQILQFDFTSLLKRRNILLLLSGLWAIAITVFLMCFMIKLKALNFSETKYPFYPSLLGFFTIIFVTGLSINLNSRAIKRIWVHILTIFLCLIILASGAARLKLHAPEATPGYVKFAQKMADFFAAGDKPKVIAFMWNDTISIDTLKFYLAYKGSKLPQKFFYTSPDGKDLLDFDIAVPSGEDIPALLSSMKEQIEENSDYIVLSTKPGVYAVDHHMLLYKYGQPVVDSLITNGKFRVVFTYELWGTPFAVLEKKGLGDT